MNLKNIKDAFVININNKDNICSLIITTIAKSFMLDYNYEKNGISINNSIKLENNELVIFAKNLNNFILIVSNISIKIYNKNLELISNKYIDEKNKNIKPLIIKYNKNLSSLFVYSNNKNLTSYKFDTDGNIIETTEIIKNVSLCSFDICKYFLVYTLWDSNDLFIYSLNTKEINNIEIPEEYLDFTKISSIQIFKHD